MLCAGRARAALSFDDTPLPEARATIDALRGLGLRVMLLSGDHAGAAARVAATVGVDDWQAGLLPEAKRAALDRVPGTLRRGSDGRRRPE